MIYVTGSTGFLGRAVCARLDALSAHYQVAFDRLNGDLRRPDEAMIQLAHHKPDTVIHLAYPGADGIGTAAAVPADLARDTLLIDANVLHACALLQVRRVITIGSVCSYPEYPLHTPTTEEELWNGAPEAVNAPYGHAKRMQLALLDAYHRQFALPYTALILTNLYGPGDQSGHVIPATIRKILRAQATGEQCIEVWGDGSARREFLYVDDAAAAVVTAALAPRALNRPINICTGVETPIRTLVDDCCAALGWHGSVDWDHTKPSGQRRRLFSNVAAAVNLGWHPRTSFLHGLRQTVTAMTAEAL